MNLFFTSKIIKDADLNIRKPSIREAAVTQTDLKIKTSRITISVKLEKTLKDFDEMYRRS